jgi:hypothetical protein
MEGWLWAVIGSLFLMIFLLFIKIHLLRKAVKEIAAAFSERIITETNTLVTISTQDKSM